MPDRYGEERGGRGVGGEGWAILELLIPATKAGGRPRRINMREVVNGSFYLLKTGWQWRMLPKDFWKAIGYLVSATPIAFLHDLWIR